MEALDTQAVALPNRFQVSQTKEIGRQQVRLGARHRMFRLFHVFVYLFLGNLSFSVF